MDLRIDFIVICTNSSSILHNVAVRMNARAKSQVLGGVFMAIYYIIRMGMLRCIVHNTRDLSKTSGWTTSFFSNRKMFYNRKPETRQLDTFEARPKSFGLSGPA